MELDSQEAAKYQSWNIYRVIESDNKDEDDDKLKLSDLMPPNEDNFIWAECLDVANDIMSEAERLYYKKPYSFVCKMKSIKLSKNYSEPIKSKDY